MATFSILIRNAIDNARNAELIASLSRDTSSSAVVERVRYAPDPADMRGIPAIGLNCPGRINGTRPDAICDRDT